MIRLGFRNLFQNKLRFFLSIGGVALAIMLIILLNGFLSGIYIQVTAYLDNMNADLVIAQDGVTNLLSATSVLSPDAEEKARGVAGIEKVTPIISQFVIMDIHNKKVVAYLVGYDPELGGGPWDLASGHPPQDTDEIVLDRVMAEEHGFSLGDQIDLLDEDFTIVGLGDGTNSWMASFIFIDKRAAEDLLMLPQGSSFILLGLDPDADTGIVQDRLENRLRDLEIVPAQTMKQNDLDLLVEIFAIPLRMMVAIAFAVGTAILGMVIYTATVERQREYGVLKAIGTNNSALYWLVTIQGLTTAVIGVITGIGLAWVASGEIMRTFPKFLIVLEPQSMLTTALVGTLMGIFAAVMPAHQVARLDPARVFHK